MSRQSLPKAGSRVATQLLCRDRVARRARMIEARALATGARVRATDFSSPLWR